MHVQEDHSLLLEAGPLHAAVATGAVSFVHVAISTESLHPAEPVEAASGACTSTGEESIVLAETTSHHALCKDLGKEGLREAHGLPSQAIAERAPLVGQSHIGASIDSPSCLDLEF